jgi:hypothetical protein
VLPYDPYHKYYLALRSDIFLAKYVASRLNTQLSQEHLALD